MTLRPGCFILLFTIGLTIDAARAGDETHWPAWRGPLATGEAPKADPPTEWSEDQNVRWKVEIPGRGHATPIIWGNRIYIQTAVEVKTKDRADADDARIEQDSFAATLRDSFQPPPPGERPRRGGGRRGGGGRDRDGPKNDFEFRVLAVDRTDGNIAWSTVVKKERPHEAGHTDASQASNSPVTDGKHLYAYFGSRGLYCLDMNGKVKWSADFGKMTTRNQFGEGSSPALHGDTLVVNWDHEGDDFLVALDKKTGKEKWRVDRDEQTNWTTPLVVDANGKPQVVINATGAVRAYDLATGKELWSCKGMTENVVPSPMVSGDLLYALSGFRGAACLAIRYKSAKGDITGSPAIAWSHDKGTPYVPSALLYHDRLYFVENNRPLLTCLDAKTGKVLYDKQRLPGLDSIYASFLGAAGRVYIVGRNGTTLVLRDGPTFELLATNKLDDGFDASPAAVGKELYLRGSHLYCLAEK